MRGHTSCRSSVSSDYLPALENALQGMISVNATFAALDDVAQVLADHIGSETGIADVQVGTPQEAVATTQPGVRITLLNAAPIPAPRNEPTPSGPGTMPSPLYISCFYLVNTSGAERDDPVAAHNALGQVMRLIHEMPVLQLPLSTQVTSLPAAHKRLGEGLLRLTQVAVSIEQVAQIWLAMRQPVQPCALLEAGPIQLTSRDPRPRPSP